MRASPKIRVQFPDGVKLSEDYIFSKFRGYGKIQVREPRIDLGESRSLIFLLQEVKIEKNVAEILYILKASAIRYHLDADITVCESSHHVARV